MSVEYGNKLNHLSMKSNHCGFFKGIDKVEDNSK